MVAVFRRFVKGVADGLWCRRRGILGGMERGAGFGSLLRLLRPYVGAFAAVYGLYFVNAVLNLLPAFSVRFYIDLVLLGNDADLWGVRLAAPAADMKVRLTLVFLGLMAGLIATANTVGVVMWRMGTRAVERVVFDLRNRILDHIHKLSLGYFHRERVGAVMTRAVTDVENISQMLKNSFNLAYQVVQFAVVPLLMLSLSPTLFLVALLPAPLIVYAFYAIRVRLRPVYRRIRDNQAEIQARVQEVVTGLREIKAFNLERETRRRYLDANRTAFELQNTAMQTFSFNHQLQYGAKDLGVVLIAFLGGIAVFAGFGGVTVGKISAFLVLSNFLYGPIGNFLMFYDIIQRGVVSWERVEGFLAVVPDVADRPGAVRLDRRGVRGSVAFRGVVFGYEPGHPVLRGIDWEVRAGERVAVVGPSGSGKSTLMSLLLRFHDPWEGAVLLDGRDLREYTQDSVRRVVGVVFQDSFLFYGTVRENLLFADPEASEAEIRRACRAAGIHEEILRLPDGYDTVVGERGVTLSGGQRQRLAIARMFLKDPAVVVLDEATSAVDTVTERVVQEGLDRLLRGRTVFVVAHRLATVRHCDRIVVLDRGRIVEEGTHRELLRRRGLYFRMCRSGELVRGGGRR